ncbi:transmembrane protein, putative [Bodo saltans]|uniref:Transmembrane protein, putative n=1 Tax=Bodo saltans TaxID=75058 RepID=A0A0S4JY38_BODSA|nr:transmembrane protein, putative [Bodo saltans]|eukprot:CUG93507.1 transmembrane protein, putative [Bodo saltans]
MRRFQASTAYQKLGLLLQPQRSAHGAPQRTRRSVVSSPAHSQRKSSKERFSLEEALIKDRERIQRNKDLPWKERLEQLKVYPWKTFVVFMILWSYAGLYAVPWLKGGDLGNVPKVTPLGQKVPEDVKQRLSQNPSLEGWIRTPINVPEKLPENNKNAPRY